jgi:hypothetical protein
MVIGAAPPALSAFCKFSLSRTSLKRTLGYYWGMPDILERSYICGILESDVTLDVRTAHKQRSLGALIMNDVKHTMSSTE